ncbi:MAG: murein hydrolase activator EnvC family protein [Neisseriaceae bacterium]
MKFKLKFLLIFFFYSTFGLALTSNEVNQNLHNINSKINQVNTELSKQKEQQRSIDNAIKYSDSAISQSNVLLKNLKKQREFNLQQLSEIQNNLNTLNQSLETFKKQTITTTNMVYQQIQRLKLDDQSILSGNSMTDSNRKKAYLLAILHDEQNKLLLFNNKIESLNKIHENLQREIDRLNKKLGITKEEQQKLQKNKTEQLTLAQSVEKDIKKTKSKLSSLKQQQTQLNQIMNQIIAQERISKQKELQRKASNNKSTLATNTVDKDSGYENNSPFLSRHLVKPITANVQLAFGQSRDNIANKGILFNYVENAPIRAITAGKTMYSGNLPGFGKVIILDHGDNYMSIYSGVLAQVKVGDKVSSGEVIANSGNRDNQPLGGFYFELRHLGKPINPNKVIN